MNRLLNRISLGFILLAVLGASGLLLAKKAEKTGEEEGCKKGVSVLIGPLSSMPQIQEKIQDLCKRIVSQE